LEGSTVIDTVGLATINNIRYIVKN
jgi:hypothetical protein